MMAKDDWTPASIMAPFGKNDEMVGEAEVVGWRSGKWFLDYRADEDADGLVHGLWALTHIPTGYLCCSVYGRLAFAKEIAAEVNQWGDWDVVDDPTAIRDTFTEKARGTAREHGAKVRFGRPALWSQITMESNRRAAA
jgi:hypothetical protein